MKNCIQFTILLFCPSMYISYVQQNHKLYKSILAVSTDIRDVHAVKNLLSNIAGSFYHIIFYIFTVADIIAIIAASVAFSIATGLVVCALVAFIMKQRARNCKSRLGVLA